MTREQISFYYNTEELLENKEIIYLLEEMFINDINELSYEEINQYLKQLNEFYISDYDEQIIHSLFKVLCNMYYHSDIGFMIMLQVSCLSKNKKNTKNGYVYVCKSDINLFKIGYSKNPEERMKQLGLGSSIKHKLLYKIPTENMHQLEKELHKKFKEKREHSEWFNLDDKDLSYIENLAFADMV
jgi:hypothetical protein